MKAIKFVTATVFLLVVLAVLLFFVAIVFTAEPSKPVSEKHEILLERKGKLEALFNLKNLELQQLAVQYQQCITDLCKLDPKQEFCPKPDVKAKEPAKK